MKTKVPILSAVSLGTPFFLKEGAGGGLAGDENPACSARGDRMRRPGGSQWARIPRRYYSLAPERETGGCIVKLGKRLRSAVEDQVIGNVATLLITGVAVAVGWTLREVPRTYLVPLGLVTAGGALFLFNQLRATGTSAEPRPTDEELRDRLISWTTTKRGFNIESVDDEDAFAFQFRVVDDSGRRVLVRRPKNGDELVLIATIQITDVETALTAQARAQLASDMKLELLRLGVMYSGANEAPARTTMFTALVGDDIYDEAAFVGRLFFIRRCMAAMFELAASRALVAQPADVSEQDTPEGP